MKKIITIIIQVLKSSFGCLGAFVLCSSFSFSQEMWDEELLNRQKVYTNLQHALEHPDSVYRLDLSKDKLKTFPLEILQLKQLRELNLNKNKLTQLPETISQLTFLQRLYINNNNLIELPATIGKLSFLQKLELNRNVIEKLPPEIGKLNNLEELSLWDNELSNIPDEIKNLGSLKVFELRGILFTEEQQSRIHDLLPYTKLYFSPSCNCKQ